MITIINSFFYCKLVVCLQHEFAGVQSLAASHPPTPSLWLLKVLPFPEKHFSNMFQPSKDDYLDEKNAMRFSYCIWSNTHYFYGFWIKYPYHLLLLCALTEVLNMRLSCNQNITNVTNSSTLFLISFSFFHQYSAASLSIQHSGNNSPLNDKKKPQPNPKTKTSKKTPKRIIIAIMIIWNLWYEHISCHTVIKRFRLSMVRSEI